MNLILEVPSANARVEYRRIPLQKMRDPKVAESCFICWWISKKHEVRQWPCRPKFPLQNNGHFRCANFPSLLLTQKSHTLCFSLEVGMYSFVGEQNASCNMITIFTAQSSRLATSLHFEGIDTRASLRFQEYQTNLPSVEKSTVLPEKSKHMEYFDKVLVCAGGRLWVVERGWVGNPQERMALPYSQKQTTKNWFCNIVFVYFVNARNLASHNKPFFQHKSTVLDEQS